MLARRSDSTQSINATSCRGSSLQRGRGSVLPREPKSTAAGRGRSDLETMKPLGEPRSAGRRTVEIAPCGSHDRALGAGAAASLGRLH
jgi:hypothetical protein